MATTNTRELTLLRQGDNVRIDVRYNAVFSVFERHLAGLGLRFREKIEVIGADPPGSTTGTVLPIVFPSPFFEVTDGSTPQKIARHAALVVSRAKLDEDSNPFVSADFDADEIRCRIRIKAIGLPLAVTPNEFTNEEVLGELVHQPAAVGKTAS